MRMTPMNILVVENRSANDRALHALLEGEDLQVLTASDSRQALELLLTHEVGLALLDIQPSAATGPAAGGTAPDGYALAEVMRGNARTRSVPIIFVTAFAPGEQRSFAGCEHGAVDFLCKPVDPRVLRSKVQVFLQLQQQRRQLAQRMAELERVTRMNASMIGALSHDIRTPLAALMLNAELVSRRSETPATQQAGARLKAATLMLSRQVDHLVNLASVPSGGTPINLQPLPALAGQPELALDIQGEATALFDPAMVARAVDHLLLLLLTHGSGQVLQLEVDGLSRRAVTLRLKMPDALGETAQAYLLGSKLPEPGAQTPRIGLGLEVAERVARAHGGSVIGRSNAREGTLFEMMLPRERAG